MSSILERGFFIRIALYLLGLFMIALGGVLTINSKMGVSPLNALPVVLSQLTSFTVGFWFIIQFCLFLLVQILILRKGFSLFQLFQLPAAVMFGFFVDFARFLVGDLFIPTYFGQLTLLFMGMFGIAAGVSVFLSTGFLPLPFEGLILTLTKKYPRFQFHQVMIAISVLVVGLSIILSFVFLGGLYGAREGTILAAVITGKLVPYVKKVYYPMVHRMNIKGMVLS